MTNYKNIALFAAITLIVQISAQDPYTLYQVTDPEARCLDGSTPVKFKKYPQNFYHAPGSQEGDSKFLVYFKGGGWIGGFDMTETLNQAYDRTKTEMGSAQYHYPTRIWKSGIFSRDPILNPNFYNWNSIHINYCDGTGHQGYKKDPINVRGKDLYFRGQINTKAIIAQLLLKFGFGNAKLVLLSGCSAGGLAVFNWANYFRSILPDSTRVMAAPDSGMFLDMVPINGSITKTYRNFYFKSFMQIANVEVDPINKQCVEANPDQKWKCLMSPYLVDYVDIPLFFVQSQYDAWSVPNILGTDCMAENTLNSCSIEQLEYIDQYHQNINGIMKKAIERHSFLGFSSWGAWASSCIHHCLEEEDAFNSQAYQVPENSNVTISHAISQWIESSHKRNDNLDSVKWPLNGACSNNYNQSFKK